jgi:hypothetical protein
MGGNLPPALPAICAEEEVHEPVLYEHNFVGALACVGGSQDASADLASRSARTAGRDGFSGRPHTQSPAG